MYTSSIAWIFSKFESNFIRFGTHLHTKFHQNSSITLQCILLSFALDLPFAFDLPKSNHFRDLSWGLFPPSLSEIGGQLWLVSSISTNQPMNEQWNKYLQKTSFLVEVIIMMMLLMKRIIIIMMIIIIIVIVIIIIIIISDPVGDAICDCTRSFFLPFFSATVFSGPYLWNRYSQRLQIECAAWSCGLILHCCLPSNSLRYFFYFILFFFRHNFVRAISLEPLLAETPN